MAEQLKAMVIGGHPVWVDVGEAPRIREDNDAYALDRTGVGGKLLKEPAPELPQADLAPTLMAVLAPIKASLTAQIGIREVTVEVTLGIKGEVGFFIAKGEANGSIKVTAKWVPEPASPAG